MSHIAAALRSEEAVAVRSVLVTGASTGIGQACALYLDRLGHRVYAGVRREQHARELRQRGSGLPRRRGGPRGSTGPAQQRVGIGIRDYWWADRIP
jgi:NAD(P)-dependent dehydrogenase (short-subunit alcohol dehydrogenase family)